MIGSPTCAKDGLATINAKMTTKNLLIAKGFLLNEKNTI
jgi:hypothetical protein